MHRVVPTTLMVIGVLGSTWARASTVTVCDSGCDASTLRDGLATTGVTTVKVGDGRYNESLDISKSVRIEATGDSVVLGCGGGAESLRVAAGTGLVQIDGLTFADCPGKRRVYLEPGAELELVDTHFPASSQPFDGSGGMVLVALPSKLTLRDSHLEGSTATGDGGHIATVNSTTGGEVRLLNTVFEGGTATRGGSLATSSAGLQLEIEGSTFTGNASSAEGGSLYVFSGQNSVPLDVRIVDSEFLEGSASSGAAMYLQRIRELSLTESLICHNSATGRSSGVYVRGWGGANKHIERNRFLDNDPSGRADTGALYLEYVPDQGSGRVQVRFNHFIGHDANPIVTSYPIVAGVGSNASGVDFTNNLFAWNSKGSSDYWLGTGNLNWISDKVPAEWNARFSGPTSWFNANVFAGANNTINADPELSEAPRYSAGKYNYASCHADVRPLPSSPLLEAGDPTLSQDGRRPNIGAYPWFEPRDRDGDGYTSPASDGEDEDCDDNDPAVNPGAEETCDGVDENCNGIADNDELTSHPSWRDADGDGFGDPDHPGTTCAQADGFVLNADDCSDASDTVFPGAEESCNGVDEDCNGVDDDEQLTSHPSWRDADGDGFGSADAPGTTCAQATGFVTNPDDCNDTDETVHPNAEERCDGVDENCNSIADDDELTSHPSFFDADGDGHGNPDLPATTCKQPDGYVLPGDDCDDDDPSRAPLLDELCNGIDDNCNNAVDESLVYTDYWVDNDGDGFGAANSEPQSTCSDPGDDWSIRTGDCADDDASRHPSADELCDEIDNDCDSLVDALDPDFDTGLLLAFFPDEDGDGFGADDAVELHCSLPDPLWLDIGGDCDDASSAIHPDATEVCNGLDDDCDGDVDLDDADYTGEVDTWWPDEDGDGFGASTGGVEACTQPDNHVLTNDDCDDRDPTSFPDGEEIAEDGIDQDCDGQDLLNQDVLVLGGGCQSAPAPAAGWLALLLVAARRRRPREAVAPDRHPHPPLDPGLRA